MPKTTESAKSILAELKSLGRDSYKSTLLRHGIREPVFGVSIAEMKKIVKRVKKDYALSLALYDTGVYDAMYLAGLIADDMAMTKADLQRWVKNANCAALCGYTVPWVASEGRFGNELALEWIESKDEGIASAGWSTLACLVALKDDAELDVPACKKLLDRVAKSIHSAPNRVRSAMNGFMIAVGSYVKELTATAIATAKKVGVVSVDVGDTECKVPDAATYIDKAKQRGAIGKKRKTVKC